MTSPTEDEIHGLCPGNRLGEHPAATCPVCNLSRATLDRLVAALASSPAQREIEEFRAHLEEVGRPVQIARDAVVNRARDVAAIAPTGQKADRDDYNTMAPCGPLYRLAQAVAELDRQEAKPKPAFRAPAAQRGDSEGLRELIQAVTEYGRAEAEAALVSADGSLGETDYQMQVEAAEATTHAALDRVRTLATALRAQRDAPPPSEPVGGD